MRRWGIVISVLYAVIVLGLLVPAAVAFAADTSLLNIFSSEVLSDMYAEWLVWVPIAAVVAGQAVLLFLSVDTSFRKLKPRAHVAITCVVAAMLFALLTSAVVYCLGAAAQGDKFWDQYLNTEASVIGIWAGLWVVWGIAFFLYFRNSANVAARAISWMLKGSVLELLIAVPCHVIVRRRGDCSAPVFTSFGIVTGIAVMLLSFGPSVLLLYKKRLDAYAARKSV